MTLLHTAGLALLLMGVNQAPADRLTIVVGDESLDLTYATAQSEAAIEFVEAMGSVDHLVLAVPATIAIDRLRAIENAAFGAGVREGGTARSLLVRSGAQRVTFELPQPALR
jgi:hypothetical protein